MKPPNRRHVVRPPAPMMDRSCRSTPETSRLKDPCDHMPYWGHSVHDGMKKVGYRYYLLGVLGLIEGYNSLDRMAWALLLQDIKRDLALSDTQLGLLSGIAFALFL
jgi:hypothetical protein